VSSEEIERRPLKKENKSNDFLHNDNKYFASLDGLDNDNDHYVLLRVDIDNRARANEEYQPSDSL